jgi:hypothetical protein
VVISAFTETLETAHGASGGLQACAQHQPRLLSDNGPCHIAGKMAR